jgi:hypothetical protein
VPHSVYQTQASQALRTWKAIWKYGINRDHI